MKKVDHIEFKQGVEFTPNTDWTEKLIGPTDLIIGNNQGIHITPKEWKKLNARHGRSAIKRLISRAILSHNLPMPLQPISKHSMMTAFKGLKHLNAKKHLRRGKVFSRFDYNWRVDDVFINAASTYNPASNYFHQHNRWLAGSAKHPSPYDAWTTPRIHNTFLNNLWSMPRPKVTKGILNSAVNLKIYVASQFKPQAAKVFYDMFNARNVLDLSSGWGDRLCGFCASTAKSYVGLDPNTRLIPGYQAQIAAYGQGKDIEMVCTGSEHYDPKGKKFDTIFTSPPYFDVEHYSDDEGQSFSQYDTFDAWCHKFFFPTLDMAWKALDDSDPERGGIICINISDIVTKNTRHRVCDRLNEYLSKKKGARYIGCMGLRLSLRPNITADADEDDKKGAAFIEPMWLWAKGGTWELDDYIENGFANNHNPVGLFK